MRFYDYIVGFDLWDIYDEAFVPKTILDVELIPLRWNKGFLFYLWFYGKKCDIPFMLKYSDLYVKFLSWENGVLQLVSEQVGPSGQVVESRSVVWQLNTVVVFFFFFLINGYVLLCDHVWLTNFNVIFV